MRVLVIGGTLFIGKALVTALLKAGHEVTVLHRKNRHKLGKKVRNLVADRNDPAAVEAAVAGHRFDVVFDNVYDWERGTTADQVLATARAVSQGLSRYVFMSSVAAYGDGLNHQEGDALAPDHHVDAYVRNKAMSERALFRLHQRSGLPVVTLRPPFVYGPGNPYYREQFFWDRLRDKKPWILPGDGRRLMQFGPEGFRSAPKDHRLVILMGASPETVEQAFASALGSVALAANGASGPTTVRWIFS